MTSRVVRWVAAGGLALGSLGCAAAARPADSRAATPPPADERTAAVARGTTTTTPAVLPVEAEDLMAVVRELASPAHEGRRTGSPGIARSRAYLVERFRRARLEALAPGYVHPFALPARHASPGAEATPADAEAANVVGVCPGPRPDAPFLIVSAHYDHLGVRDGVRYPGADDNASGVAVLLAVADTCRRVPRRHALVLVAFDAEEIGLAGARAFVADPPVALERLSAMVNLDMLGRSTRRELFVAGTAHWPHLRPPLERVAARAALALHFGYDAPGGDAGSADWTQASDHGPFHDAGVPFVYFGVEDHADYHRPSDTADAVDPGFLVAAAAVVLDAIHELDRAADADRDGR